MAMSRYEIRTSGKKPKPQGNNPAYKGVKPVVGKIMKKGDEEAGKKVKGPGFPRTDTSVDPY